MIVTRLCQFTHVGRMNPDPVFDIERPPLLEAPYRRFPLLDLSRVPEERWVSALERFHPATYSLSVNSVEADRIGRAIAAKGQAELNRAIARDRRKVRPESWWFPPGLPTPDAGPAATRRQESRDG